MKPQRRVMVGLLIIAASVLAVGLFAPWVAQRVRDSGSSSAGSVTLSDLAGALSRWNGKNVDTYQIEVWTGGITPPPPVYVVQVWRGTVVYAHMESHPAAQRTTPQALAADSPEALAVTVPGLFDVARKRVQAYVNATVTFDPQWGFPNNMGTKSGCIDCTWFSRVQKFETFGSDAPPPTPTRRP